MLLDLWPPQISTYTTKRKKKPAAYIPFHPSVPRKNVYILRKLNWILMMEKFKTFQHGHESRSFGSILYFSHVMVSEPRKIVIYCLKIYYY